MFRANYRSYRLTHSIPEPYRSNACGRERPLQGIVWRFSDTGWTIFGNPASLARSQADANYA